MFFSTRSLFVGWSTYVKVHRVSSQTISWSLFRFSTGIVNNNILFLLFFFGLFCFSFFFSFFFFAFCLYVYFLFETKNIYSDTHSAMRVGKWWKDFHPSDFRKQDHFFGPSGNSSLVFKSIFVPTRFVVNIAFWGYYEIQKKCRMDNW